MLFLTLIFFVALIDIDMITTVEAADIYRFPGSIYISSINQYCLHVFRNKFILILMSGNKSLTPK